MQKDSGTAFQQDGRNTNHTKMLLCFKMVVYKFTEKMRGHSDLWLQGLDFLSSYPGFVLRVPPNPPPLQPGWCSDIYLTLMHHKGITGKMMQEHSQIARRVGCVYTGLLICSVVNVADACEEVTVSIRLLIKSSAHLPDRTRQIHKQNSTHNGALTASHSDRG